MSSTLTSQTNPRILGIPYDSKKLTFIGIRNDLAKLTNDQDVTVPTLEVKQGEYITNSFDIAEWVSPIAAPSHIAVRNI